MASGTLEAIFPAASREYVPLVEELCGSAAFQATYKRRNELEMLPSISSYFLEQARLFTKWFIIKPQILLWIALLISNHSVKQQLK